MVGLQHLRSVAATARLALCWQSSNCTVCQRLQTQRQHQTCTRTVAHLHSCMHTRTASHHATWNMPHVRKRSARPHPPKCAHAHTHTHAHMRTRPPHTQMQASMRRPEQGALSLASTLLRGRDTLEDTLIAQAQAAAVAQLPPHIQVGWGRPHREAGTESVGLEPATMCASAYRVHLHPQPHTSACSSTFRWRFCNQCRCCCCAKRTHTPHRNHTRVRVLPYFTKRLPPHICHAECAPLRHVLRVLPYFTKPTATTHIARRVPFLTTRMTSQRGWTPSQGRPASPRPPTSCRSPFTSRMSSSGCCPGIN